MWNCTDDPSKLRYSKVGDYEVAVNHWDGCGLEVYIRGFGVAGLAEGCGRPLFVRLDDRDEGPLVYIWDNIHDEEPSHRVSLLGAAESRLQEDNRDQG
jgi:hypothetical protein